MSAVHSVPDGTKLKTKSNESHCGNLDSMPRGTKSTKGRPTDSFRRFTIDLYGGREWSRRTKARFWRGVQIFQELGMKWEDEVERFYVGDPTAGIVNVAAFTQCAEDALQRAGQSKVGG